MRVHPGSSSPNGVAVAVNGGDVANVTAVAAATTAPNGTNGNCNGSASTRTSVVVTAEAELYRKKVGNPL